MNNLDENPIDNNVTDKDETWPWWLPNLVMPTRLVGFVVSFGYLILTVIWTWPMLPQINVGVIAPLWGIEQPDISQNVWNVWHFVNTWYLGNPFMTQAIFYPQQINLFHQSYGFMQLLMVAPIAHWFGPIVGANTILAMGYWGGAIGMFLLLLPFTNNKYLAFFLGWIYVIAPAHQMNVAMSADENAAVQWIVLLHLSLVWWLRQPTYWRTGLVCFVLVVNTLASGYLGLFGIVYAVLFVLFAIVYRRNSVWTKQLLLHGACIGVLWLTVVSILLMPSWSRYPYQSEHFLSLEEHQQKLGIGDWYQRQSNPLLVISVVDLIIPTENQRFWNWILPDVVLKNGSQMGGYIGVLVLTFVCVGLFQFPQVRIVVVFAGILLLLAAGLQLRIFPDSQSMSLPGIFWLLDLASPFRNASRPGLFMLWAWIPLLLTFSFVVKTWNKPILTAVLVLCIYVDYAPIPWTISRQEADPAASLLAQTTQKDDYGSVLTIPFGKNDPQPLLDQVCHGRPIAAGYLARIPSFLTSMRGIIKEQNIKSDVIPIRPIDELANLDIRYVVLKKNAPEYSRVILQKSGAELILSQFSEEVWRIPRTKKPALLPGYGWGEPEEDITSQWYWQKWRWSTSNSEILILSQQDSVASIAIGIGGLSAKTVSVRVNGTGAFVLNAPELPVVSNRVIHIPIHAGLNQIVFSSPVTKDGNRELGVLFAQLELVDSDGIVGGASLPTAPYYSQRWLCP